MKDETAGTRSPRLELRPFHGRSSRSVSRLSVRRSFPVLLTTLFLATCSEDSTEPLPAEIAEVGVVMSSVDLSLTIFEVENPAQTRTVGLGPAGSPVTMAVRGELAAVPLGFVPAVAVVDLKSATLLRTVGLPEGSGATGVAFLSDSIVLVANPNLNSVTPVNVLRGTRGDSIPVGRFPQAVVAEGGRAFVLNAELDEFFAPDGPSTVSVIDATTLQVTFTVTLSGENAAAGAVGADGRLYIVNSGSFGAADGSFSLVDITSLTEVANHPGFGEFPGSLALGPSARAFVGAFSYGVVVWDISLEAFIRGPSDALKPGDVPNTSGLGFDEAGRLYTLTPDCQNPSTANRHDSAYDVDLTIPVGICPFVIAFTSVEDA
jgi:hypothetical protein